MSNEKQNLEYGEAKREFIAAINEIIPLLNMGHTRRFIYKKMIDEKNFTMKYDAFCYHVRKITIHDDENKKEKSTSRGVQYKQNPIVTVSTANKSFIEPSALPNKRRF